VFRDTNKQTVRTLMINMLHVWNYFIKNKSTSAKASVDEAEREGFEPSIRFPVYTLSRRAPSTTRTPLLEIFNRAANKPRNYGFNKSLEQLVRPHNLIIP
jgi:hypothetical protein